MVATETMSFPGWSEPLCDTALVYPTASLSVRQLFEQAAPNLDDPQFVQVVSRVLAHRPELVETWQQYSHAKRSTPSPYLDGTTVGFVDEVDGKLRVRRVQTFDSIVDSCATFILHESAWVLEQRRIT